MANSAIDLEQGPMQETVGFQDQCASAFGGLIIIEANGSKVSPRRFITTKLYEEYITSSLLMGFDGLERNSQICSSKISKSVSSVSNEQLMKELTFFFQMKELMLFQKRQILQLMLKSQKNVGILN